MLKCGAKIIINNKFTITLLFFFFFDFLKKQLSFSLVADEEHALMEAFGTWGERTFMGRAYLGTSRSTFLIDPHGTIAHVWEKVKPAGHAEEVLAKIQELAHV